MHKVTLTWASLGRSQEIDLFGSLACMAGARAIASFFTSFLGLLEGAGVTARVIGGHLICCVTNLVLFSLGFF